MAVAERSWVLRVVVPCFSKEAKACASPSPSSGGFDFVGLHRDYAYYADYATKVGVRTSAFFPKADIHGQPFRLSPNVCFRP